MSEQNKLDPAILEQLAKLKPYTLVVFKKGANYHNETTRAIIQTEHLPHTFKQKDQGILSIAMPIREESSETAAIGIYNIMDKAIIKQWLDADPAVQKGIFIYEILSCIGMEGDKLL